jgi:hypothetical protein
VNPLGEALSNTADKADCKLLLVSRFGEADVAAGILPVARPELRLAEYGPTAFVRPGRAPGKQDIQRWLIGIQDRLVMALKDVADVLVAFDCELPQAAGILRS